MIAVPDGAIGAGPPKKTGAGISTPPTAGALVEVVVDAASLADSPPDFGHTIGRTNSVRAPRTKRRRRSYTESDTQLTLRSNAGKRKACIAARLLRDVRDRFAAQVGDEFADSRNQGGMIGLSAVRHRG